MHYVEKLPHDIWYYNKAELIVSDSIGELYWIR